MMFSPSEVSGADVHAVKIEKPLIVQKFGMLLRCNSKPCFKERYEKEFRIIDKCNCKHFLKYFYMETLSLYKILLL